MRHFKLFTISWVVACMTFWSSAVLAQSVPAAPIEPPAKSSHVTLTQQAPPSARQAEAPRVDSLCSAEAWERYFDSYPADAASIQGTPRVEQLPDEQVAPAARVEEIPDERVQALPRIGSLP
jgi:hypothetical protein